MIERLNTSVNLIAFGLMVLGVLAATAGHQPELGKDICMIAGGAIGGVAVHKALNPNA